MSWPSLLAAASVSFTLLIFSPISVYVRNAVDFPFLLKDFTPWGLSTALVGTLFLSWTVSRLRSPTRERGIILLTSLGWALWVQSTFLVWTLDALDGGEIRGAKHGIDALDLLVWMALVGIPQIWSGLRRESVALQLSLIVLFAQSSGLLFGVLKTREYPEVKGFGVDTRAMFRFSTQSNVILIVLDEFQSDVFAELAAADTKLHSEMDGFTYFRNTLSPSPQTFPSIPTMLTERVYDNSITAPEFVETSFRDNSLFKRLKSQNFQVDIYPGPSETVYVNPEQASNIKRRAIYAADLLKLFDAGLFKCVPFVLKPLIYQRGAWLTYAATAKYFPTFDGSAEERRYYTLPGFRDGMTKATAEEGLRTLKYYHLNGMHVPLAYDEDLRRANPPYSRQSFSKQARGAVKVILAMIRELKRMGIYERSLIIICSDHGSGRSPDMWITPTDPSRESFNRSKARGASLLLAKRPNEHGPLRTSLVPAHLTDIPATVISTLGLDSKGFTGTSVFKLDADKPRERRHYVYDWRQFNPLYLSTIHEYSINGDCWDDTSWTPTGRIFEPPVK